MLNADNSNVWKTVIFAFALLLSELLLFFLQPLFALIFHLLIVALLILFCKNTFKNKEDARYPLLLLVATVGAPIFGPLGLLIMAALTPIFARFAESPTEWLKELFAEKETTPFATIFQRIQIGWDDYKEPREIATFKDIFTFGSLIQKQAVLDAIVKDYRPIYAPILREALYNPSNTIRLQAAAILSKVDLDFDVRMQELFRIKAENPEDISVSLKIADVEEAYANSGILENFRKQEALQIALQHYEEYLKKVPENRAAILAIGRVLFQLGDYNAFIDWYKNYKEKFKDIPSIVNSWYLESSYMLLRKNKSKGF